MESSSSAKRGAIWKLVACLSVLIDKSLLVNLQLLFILFHFVWGALSSPLWRAVKRSRQIFVNQRSWYRSQMVLQASWKWLSIVCGTMLYHLVYQTCLSCADVSLNGVVLCIWCKETGPQLPKTLYKIAFLIRP